MLGNGLPTTPQGWTVLIGTIVLLIISTNYPSMKSEISMIKLINEVRAQKKRIKNLKRKLGK